VGLLAYSGNIICPLYRTNQYDLPDYDHRPITLRTEKISLIRSRLIPGLGQFPAVCGMAPCGTSIARGCVRLVSRSRQSMTGSNRLTKQPPRLRRVEEDEIRRRNMYNRYYREWVITN
jgi:hypothetical protein